MFHDLFWAFYWIDVVSGLGSGGLLGILAFSAFVGLGGFLLFDMTANVAPRVSSFLKVFIPTFILSLVMCFIPSKQTMYLMLGTKMTDQALQTELGKKLTDAVNLTIDDYLNKFNKKEGK